MLIAPAYAQTAETADAPMPPMPAAPDPMQAFIWNIGLVLVLVAMFYVLLIRPQQRRFKEHSQMLSGLSKGDQVITGGGLIGKIDKIINDDEMLIDLGSGVKVTALRSTIQGRNDPLLKKKAANDQKQNKQDEKKQ